MTRLPSPTILAAAVVLCGLSGNAHTAQDYIFTAYPRR